MATSLKYLLPVNLSISARLAWVRSSSATASFRSRMSKVMANPKSRIIMTGRTKAISRVRQSRNTCRTSFRAMAGMRVFTVFVLPLRRSVRPPARSGA